MTTIRTESAPPRRSLPPLMQLTDAAADRLRALYENGQQGRLLRISVGTKGCSGLSYEMNWVDEPAPTDEQVSDKGVTVLIDRKATLFLIGTVMDYKVEKFTSGFTFENPNEKGRCGCGESFHV
ncbi:MULTISPECIES: iron-sulfur cluster assembly accessory protein [Acidiphilium]|jgi:iron-sulfur cluster assembly protein|uniref:Iron-sulfur cluster assembly accessory protein n=2 Tax=Acidiphilium TaxID=522 RepID=A5G0S9_ACICJ|nr:MULTISPECIES: iron-sulfur cluster assembly accessory protein [Acidiphilium]MBU6358376.1 iron-sulfur cluster assembly accessory protein [Rhodospirillales bacterium]ABQ31461.1 iron-sulfur cluster assembly accessory protein [Acidiphilium cryptum JF-5]KDM67154.1 iron-binding protein IscA [Acidiphilium sp. JA12-A1]MDE2326529.1 iron-sulfur cluster assembly accessory protein [Rhodospirillales bacterium]UNC13833.1 iron-sulfur cluster assembly accessory protein [Acidiphilium multivorum]